MSCFIAIDFDDTLRRTMPGYLRILQDLLTEHRGITIEDDKLASIIAGRPVGNSLRALFPRADDVMIAKLTDDVFTMLIADMQPDDLVYGTQSALPNLRKFGEIAIVTNSRSDMAEAAIGCYGMRDLVHDLILVTPDLHPDLAPKPAGDLLTAAAKGSAAEQKFMIGDSVHDIEAANAAGFISIGFTGALPEKMRFERHTQLMKAGAHCVVGTLSGVQSYIASRISTSLTRESHHPQSELRRIPT